MAFPGRTVGSSQICFGGYTSLLDIISLDTKRDLRKNKETMLKVFMGRKPRKSSPSLG